MVINATVTFRRRSPKRMRGVARDLHGGQGNIDLSRQSPFDRLHAGSASPQSYDIPKVQCSILNRGDFTNGSSVAFRRRTVFPFPVWPLWQNVCVEVFVTRLYELRYSKRIFGKGVAV